MTEQLHIRIHEIPDGEIAVSVEQDDVVEVLREDAEIEQDGTIQTEHTYGEDPRHHKG